MTEGTDLLAARRAGEEVGISALDAFERLQVAAIQLEAIANAASAAIDEYRLPASGSRRDFDRVHALVSTTAENADTLVELAKELKASIR